MVFTSNVRCAHLKKHKQGKTYPNYFSRITHIDLLKKEISR